MCLRRGEAVFAPVRGQREIGRAMDTSIVTLTVTNKHRINANLQNRLKIRPNGGRKQRRNRKRDEMRLLPRARQCEAFQNEQKRET
jgi:hypothetical protein